MPVRQVGRLIMVGDLATSPSQRDSTVMYARVSSADQHDDLDRHVARVTTWATSQGHSIDRVVTEVGSGLNGKRRTFLGSCPTRLSRPSSSNIVIASPVSVLTTSRRRCRPTGDDLVGDMTEVLSSFCARLHGRRGAAHRAAKALAAVQASDDAA